MMIKQATHNALWLAGERGVDIVGMHGVRQLSILPSPAAVALEICVDGPCGDGRIADNVAVLNQNFLLLPGSRIDLKTPIANFINVRPALFGSTAFNKLSTDYLLPEGVAGTQFTSAGVVGTTQPTDGRMLGPASSVFIAGDCTPAQYGMALSKRSSLSVAAFAASQASTELVPVYNGMLAGAAPSARLMSPWCTIPLEICQRYRRLRLRLTITRNSTGATGSALPVSLVSSLPAIFGSLGSAWTQTVGGVVISATTYTVDFGAPSDNSSPFNTYAGQSVLATLQNVTATAQVSAVWILDDGEPSPGVWSPQGAVVQSTMTGAADTTTLYGSSPAGRDVMVHVLANGQDVAVYAGEFVAAPPIALYAATAATIAVPVPQGRWAVQVVGSGFSLMWERP